MNLIAQATSSFWSAPNGSSQLWMMITIGLLAGVGLFVGLIAVPATMRRYIVGAVTFLAGLYWVLFFIWPIPIDRKPGELPNGPVEGVGFWLKDANGTVSSFGTILSAFMIGMGVYSLLRVHLTKITRKRPDWGYSVVLLASIVIMAFFGYGDWMQTIGPKGSDLQFQKNWTFMQYGRDLLFEGLLQQMDAAMFSVIAFYILSAAYRAFRIRSIESTILLAAALIVVVSKMGAVTFMVDVPIAKAAETTPFLANFQIGEISKWISDTVQTSSIQGVKFGVGLGALAMGLRMWLSLEKTGGRS